MANMLPKAFEPNKRDIKTRRALGWTFDREDWGQRIKLAQTQYAQLATVGDHPQ